MKTILITGASSGIGYQTAQMLAEKGYRVYGAARRVDKMKPLEKFGVIPIYLDITDEESLQNCVEKMLLTEGHIDTVINNAGYGSYGTVEDVSLEEAKRQFEVNLFGLARLTQLVLPSMRQQQYGKIINMSSMGGRITSAMGAWYHATKFALEGFTDCLRSEVAEFGIEVVLIEPGVIKTDWGLIAADHLLQTSGEGAYRQAATKVAESYRRIYRSDKNTGIDPVVRAIATAVEKKKPKTRYLIGVLPKLLVFLKLTLPGRMYDKLMKSV